MLLWSRTKHRNNIMNLESIENNTYIPFNLLPKEGSICSIKSLNVFPYRLKEYVPIGALYFNWAKDIFKKHDIIDGSLYNVHITKEGKPDFIFKSRTVEHKQENVLASHYLSIMFFHKYNFFPYTLHPNIKRNVINKMWLSTRHAQNLYCVKGEERNNDCNIMLTPSGYIYNNDGNCIGFLEIPYKLYILMLHKIYSMPFLGVTRYGENDLVYADLIYEILHNQRLVIDDRYDPVSTYSDMPNNFNLLEHLHTENEIPNKQIHIEKVDNIFEYITGKNINIKPKKRTINL